MKMHTTESGKTQKNKNVIEIKKAGAGIEVIGQEIILLVDKKITKPKKYKALLKENGKLRIAFFMPQDFYIENGMLISDNSTYKRISE